MTAMLHSKVSYPEMLKQHVHDVDLIQKMHLVYVFASNDRDMTGLYNI